MNYGVIDIGSNSVRLLVQKNGLTTFKTAIITKLAEGMNDSRVLTNKSIERTANAVLFLYNKAIEERLDFIYIFATAAVRTSSNKDVFIDKIKKLTGIEIDVVSGELEGKLGHLGVFNGRDGGIIDIGGASSEITVYSNGKLIYSKSLPIGAVNLTNKFGQDGAKIQSYVKYLVKEYGVVPKTEFKTIGGTACNVCSVFLKLKEFDSKLVDNYIINKDRLVSLCDKLKTTNVEERENIVGLQKQRAVNFLSGTIILSEIMHYLGIDSVSHSEKDNLEGYLIYKMENL